MRKIKLDLDRLSVETFETAAEAEPRGTVHGQWSQPGTCDAALVATCQFGGTCGLECRTMKCTMHPCY